MNAKTTLVLLLVLGLLGGAIFWQQDREEGTLDLTRRLFEGVATERVVALRVDNIERAYNLRLERDASGNWFMTDPIAYPAAPEIVKLLLEDVAGAQAVRTPEAEWGATNLGFDPPRVVFSVEERLDDGTSRTSVVELGAPDPDRMRVNVRQDGEYYRALARLYSTLNQELEGFRARRVLTIDPRSVVEITRSGKLLLELGEETVDTEFVAYLDGFRWFGVQPKRALLSPLDVGIVVVGAARLRVASFTEDEPRDLVRYHLDPPDMRLDFKTVDGTTETLLIGRLGNKPPWYMTRVGAPHVWAVDDADMERLMYPVTEMYDRRFMRVLREDVDGLLLAAGGKELALRRSTTGWTVAAGSGAALIADVRVIDDALARLEDLEFGLLPEDAAPPFVPVATLAVEIAGERLGGAVTEPLELEGVEGEVVLFRRDGDELLFAADPWMLELARRPFTEFRSKELLQLTENELSGLHLTDAAGRTASFERDGQGLWHREGEEAEAVALLPLLDSLVYLKADAFVAPATPLEDALTVRYERFKQVPLELTVGGLEGGSAARVGGEVSTLKVADLHARLQALLEG